MRAMATSQQVVESVSSHHSSPVKPSTGHSTREDLETHTVKNKLTYDAQFLTRHLSILPEDFPKNWSWCGEWTNKINDPADGPLEKKMYPTVCTLLSKISHEIHAYLCNAAQKTRDHTPGTFSIPSYSWDPHRFLDLLPNKPIVFVNHANHPLSHHFHRISYKPDLLGLDGSIEFYASYLVPEKDYGLVKSPSYKGVPWSLCESVLGAKPTGDPVNRAASYLYYLLQARPDKPGVYGLALTRSSYSILWSDASSVVASEKQPWNELHSLYTYIFSLYIPPENHVTRDLTIRRDSGLDLVPTWEIQSGDSLYKKCEFLDVASPWGRRTCVYSCVQPGNTSIIKDVYRDDGRRYDEASLIRAVHEDGIIPSIVQIRHSENVKNRGMDIKTASDTPSRTKTRIVMSGTGVSLFRCQSVKDILMVTYDIIEALRITAIGAKRRVLHRDISPGNVRAYPHLSPPAGSVGFSKRWKSIKHVLGQSSNPDATCALIIDWDNGAELPSPTQWQSVQEAKGELAGRTGTPMYIARSVAAGRPLPGNWRTFAAMPVLEDKARSVYFDAYGEDEYRRYTDTPLNHHGGSYGGKKQAGQFYHRPDHDVESTFWVLLAVLLRVQPRDGKLEETPPDALVRMWRSLEGHEITSKRSDSRYGLFSEEIEDIAQALHEDLSSLASLIYKLLEQVSPEYAYLTPHPPEEHLHEAFRRLLLDHIVNMPDDIPLNVGARRNVDDGSPSLKSTSRSNVPCVTSLHRLVTSLAESQNDPSAIPYKTLAPNVQNFHLFINEASRAYAMISASGVHVSLQPRFSHQM